MTGRSSNPSLPPRRSTRAWDVVFWTGMVSLGAAYLGLIVAMVAADLKYAAWTDVQTALGDERVRYAIALSLLSSTISAIASVWVAVPTGYVLSRSGEEALARALARHPRLLRASSVFRSVAETLLDIPIVLPPLVVGISLLVLFQSAWGRWLDDRVGDILTGLGFAGIRGVTYEVPAVILAQFTVTAAFAIRTMRVTFDQIDTRPQRVALTLGASTSQAFFAIGLPQSWKGMVAAATLAWARALGEFGPVLVFAGTTRMKTEVLPTTVYLNFTMGNLRGAVAASVILLILASVVLLMTRLLAQDKTGNLAIMAGPSTTVARK